MSLVSVVIPSRNEKYLQKTIMDLLAKSRGEIEIIAVLDGYWPPVDEIVEEPRVKYIHYSKPRGMRNAINAGVAIAKGEYILKTDAHCMFAEGYDVALAADCAEDWVVVPRRKRLDPEKWEIIEGKLDVDHMYLSKDLHGVIWEDRTRKSLDVPIDEIMSSQGSCWFMPRKLYDELELMDEVNYGTFAQEFQEVGLKAWLSGKKVVVNKKTWYAHWHKVEGRGYNLDKREVLKAEEYTKLWISKKIWHKQIHDLDWLVHKFSPVPTWN